MKILHTADSTCYVMVSLDILQLPSFLCNAESSCCVTLPFDLLQLLQQCLQIYMCPARPNSLQCGAVTGLQSFLWVTSKTQLSF